MVVVLIIIIIRNDIIIVVVERELFTTPCVVKPTLGILRKYIIHLIQMHKKTRQPNITETVFELRVKCILAGVNV